VQRDRWDRVFGVAGRARVLDILQALQNTKDYHRHRADLTLQVWGLLEAMDEDAELAGQVTAIAEDRTTCADSIAERFSEMHLQALIAQTNRATDVQQDGLLQLGLGLFRLERLQRFARMDIATRESLHQQVDPIEVKLAYSVALAQEMGLPGQPSSFRYGDLANVTPAQRPRKRDRRGAGRVSRVATVLERLGGKPESAALRGARYALCAAGKRIVRSDGAGRRRAGTSG
jgi:hypothetical protein